MRFAGALVGGAAGLTAGCGVGSVSGVHGRFRALPPRRRSQAARQVPAIGPRSSRPGSERPGAPGPERPGPQGRVWPSARPHPPRVRRIRPGGVEDTRAGGSAAGALRGWGGARSCPGGTVHVNQMMLFPPNIIKT